MFKEIKKAIKKKIVKVKSALRPPVMTRRNSEKFFGRSNRALRKAEDAVEHNKNRVQKVTANITRKAKTEKGKSRALARVNKIGEAGHSSATKRYDSIRNRRSKQDNLSDKKIGREEKIMSEFKAIGESSARKPQQGNGKRDANDKMNPDYHLANFKKALNIKRVEKYKKRSALQRVARIRNIRAGRDKYDNG